VIILEKYISTPENQPMLIFNLLIYILFYRLDKSSLFCPAGKTISLFLWVEQTFHDSAGLFLLG